MQKLTHSDTGDRSSKASGAATRTSERKKPILDRGVKRVKSLLRAAEQCFAEVGYGAASMTAVARRANAPIGSLYQFFSTKESVAVALIEQYVAELKTCWDSLSTDGPHDDYAKFARQLVTTTLEQIDRQPAFSTLEDAQANFGLRPGNHDELLLAVIGLIGRLAPSASAAMRDKLGLITFQMLKAAYALHQNDNEIKGDIDVVVEMSSIIAGYLRRNIT
ncbi:TetR/AcrR family transcriptional regulator [Sphingobium sp. SCG-1]|uniref:TetR/AcrR family transcriptional regulator n=1 Tax=Sphingobium sp. SCG-1 TaxID=2072936 RepID=UPI000CD6A707|nr:TetR/AcrR family transcriptional regulator [Sphingobium sp. SCG-1]AUW58786.1 TetR/AcrR family transcriptional regulator [Sphingobium sp. SCG-1]